MTSDIYDVSFHCSIYFYGVLKSCFENNPELTPEAVLKAIERQREDFAFATLEPNILNYEDAKMLQEKFWYTHISRTDGFCFVFDASRVLEYKSVAISEFLGNPYINLTLRNIGDGYDVTMIKACNAYNVQYMP
jgi:hypothetical protein